MAQSSTKARIVILPVASLPEQPWWPKLHSLINEAYAAKDYNVFPESWSRIDLDPTKGARGLIDELGARGHYAVAFDHEDLPMAGGGMLPYRGDNWINETFEKSDAELANRHLRKGETSYAEWETCCWCVRPSARGQRLTFQLLDAFIPFLKAQGAQRFYTNYIAIETGNFWPKLGFHTVPDVGGMLPKGFQTDPNKEGLRADVHFGLGMMEL